MMTNPSDRSHAPAGWIVAFLFLVVFAIGAWKPLHLDNMDFPAVSEATSQSGVPVYYRGEQNPQATGLYHPPLYIYLLAFWFKIFGAGAAQARMFGAVCALLQGWCALQLLRQLFGSRYMRSISVWFWPVYALNAYTIQAATIADIDSTIYGPLLCLLLLSVLRLMWHDGDWRTDAIKPIEYVYPVLALSVCLWTKLTTVWLVLPFIFLLLIARLGWRMAAAVSCGITAAGIGLFLVTYWMYGIVANLSTSFTYEFTWVSFRNKGATGSVGFAGWLSDRWLVLKSMIPFTVRWAGLAPYWACGLAGCIGLWCGLRRGDRRLLHGALILWLACLTTAYYCMQTPTFGSAPFKYVYVYWAIIICGLVAISFPPRSDQGSADTPSVLAWSLPWCCAALAGLVLIKDRTLSSMYGTDAIIWPLLVPGILLLAGLALRWFGRESLSTMTLAATLALYGGFQIGTAVYQNRQDYATTYDYGQRGFTDTVGFVRTHTGPDDIIISMKDIGYAARRKYFENYAAVYGSPVDQETLQKLLHEGRAKYAIFTEAHGQDQLVVNPPLRDWVLQNCRLTASFGDYRIYEYASAKAAVSPVPSQ